MSRNVGVNTPRLRGRDALVAQGGRGASPRFQAFAILCGEESGGEGAAATQRGGAPRPRRLLCALLLALLLPAAARAGDTAASYRERVAPLLEKYCVECHKGAKPKGGVNLSGTRNAAELTAGSDVWYRVRTQLESHAMPPKDEEQPSDEERAALTGWVRGDFTQSVIALQKREGRSKLRRFNRVEYANTMEDLFGVRPAVEQNLPSDNLVDGYTKVSAALPFSAEGAMGYLKMAEDELKWVFDRLPKIETPVEPGSTRLAVHAPARESTQSKGHLLEIGDGTVVSFNTDNNSGNVKYQGAETPGYHKVRVSVYGYQTDKPLAFGIFTGKVWAYPQQIDLVEIMEAPPGKPAVLETELYLRHNAGIRFIPFGLGVPVPKNSIAANCKAPGLAVQWMETVEPELPVLAERFVTADFPAEFVEELRKNQQAFFPKKAGKVSIKTTTLAQYREIVEKSLGRIGARLYRRDLTAEELAGFTNEVMRQVEEDEVRAKVAFLSQVFEMMTAPDFLCVVEKPGKLDDFALASRLSYFLWNSTPDEKLFETARTGRLHQPAGLRAETERLLNDPKATRFLEDFTDQWLGLRAIAETSPDSKLYPDYDELLRFSSVRETRQFFRGLVQENASVRNFVAAPYAWVNAPLAKHYGLPEVKGLALQKVKLPAGSPYGGFWTQSAVMKVTANGTNTSPVKRGVWVSERLLGMHIPPPPPNINPVQPDVRGAKTLREQLALHSQQASCAGCHARFDPYGFALESFDVVGGFRTNFRTPDLEVTSLPAAQRQNKRLWKDGLPVDCAGRTPEGREFKDINGLRDLLAYRPRQLAVGFVRHLITYATGTPPTGADEPAIDAIVDGAAQGDYPVRTLIHRLVESELFQYK